MTTYLSPTGNPEEHDEKPEGYYDVGEWVEKHPMPEPDPEAERRARSETIKNEMREVDLAGIRSLRAMVDGSATDEDREWLAKVNKKMDSLRAELRELEGEKNG